MDVFNILKPNGNDKISLFDKSSSSEFLYYLKNYYLSMRAGLDLSSDYTFGVEIETEMVTINKFRDIMKEEKYKDWEFKREDSLWLGREVCSPLLHDDKNSWNILIEMLKNLSNISEICLYSGGHIHIGTQIFGNNEKYYFRLLKLWAAYENIIFRFGYGEFLTERTTIEKYAKPILNNAPYFDKSDNIFDFFKTKLNAISYYNFDSQKNNEECNVGSTIEVRSPNGSLNPIIWQNNINFFFKLFLYAKSDNYNEDLIDERIKIMHKLTENNLELDYYRKMDMAGALELADLIFDKTIDKVYFLRQYIKNEAVGSEKLEKGKKFTKWEKY